MTFSRIRAIGAWTTGSAPTSGELELIDQNLARALDGHSGGTYAPAAQLILGGSGLRVDGPFETNGTNHVKAGMVVDTAGTFDCQRQADFTGVVNVKNGLNVSTAGNLTCSRPATFSGTATFNGTVGINNVLTIDAAGGLVCYGAAGFSDQVVCSGGLYVSNVLQMSDKLQLYGAGQIQWRMTNLADADANISPSTVDEARLPQNVASARTINILNTGAVQGSRIRVTRRHLGSTSGDINVRANGGVPAINMGSSTGYRSWAEFTYDGSVWYISAESVN